MSNFTVFADSYRFWAYKLADKAINHLINSSLGGQRHHSREKCAVVKMSRGPGGPGQAQESRRDPAQAQERPGQAEEKHKPGQSEDEQIWTTIPGSVLRSKRGSILGSAPGAWKATAEDKRAQSTTSTKQTGCRGQSSKGRDNMPQHKGLLSDFGMERWASQGK